MKLISILDLEYLKWYQRYNFLADENIRILAEIVDTERELRKVLKIIKKRK